MTWQKLEQFVKDTIRPLKGRKREQAAFVIAALCFSGGFALGGGLVPKFNADPKWIAWVPLTLYVLGALAFAYAFVRYWRLVHPPELPPAKDRPSAIKGPMAFTEADGELFRKLGRESELQKLLGMALDDQLVMVVVRGASGAGKTSLLRAGLKHILKNNPDGKDVQFHYWEAVPTKPDEGLLRAIQEKWPEGSAKPASLDELVNPADALGRQSHVIVLDQFEQLRGSRKIFSLLRRIVRESKPPHRITWVIAFRREFSADWMDFVSPELERGFRPPQDVSLRLFTPEQAREVIGQLVNESNLKDSIEQSVINNLVEAATVESEVSPVDIGIGLLVLAELHERQSGNTITIRDYQFAGGAEGLLTQYISRCLDLFPKESQEAILKAMLALRDAETNQRLAEGLTVDELATESGAESRLLKTQLDRLSHRDTRLLETVTPTDGSPIRYRLPHERLIPALYRLTGKLLAEVDQAKLKFQNAFQAWKTNDRRSHYLLKTKELKLVERYETQIPWGNDEQEKKGYLNRSKRQRTVIRIASVAAATLLIISGWVASVWYQRFEHKRYLFESGYPRELYDWQPQLRKLQLTDPFDLERFDWLSSSSVEELELDSTSSANSLAGLISLSKCRKLKKMTLSLGSSQVIDLKPLDQLTQLTQLTLDLSGSRVIDLKPLKQLKGLTQLTLNLGEPFGRFSQVIDLKPLEELKGLQQLTLNLGSSQVSDLKPLEQLKGLRLLALDLRNSQVSSVEPLSKLSNLQQLTLKLEDDISDPSKVSNLESLSMLRNLQQLTLFPSGSRASNLELLSKLNGLQQLTLLNTSSSQVINWEPLTKLSNLRHLTLDLEGSQLTNLGPLSKLSNLQQLTIYLSRSQTSDLESLSKLSNLQRLTLSFGYSQVVNLESLSKLNNLQQLSVGSSQVINLESLSKMSSLRQLTLDLQGSQVINLEPLSKMDNLQQLTLDLQGSQVINLMPLLKLNNSTHLTLALSRSLVSDLKPLEQLKGLTHLTLSLNRQVSDLMSLEQLKGLTQLTLDLSDNQVIDLKPLEQLKELTSLKLILSGTSKEKNLEVLGQFPKLKSLSIAGATTEQRRSLHKIPASVVELKF